jgi:hypothetical protein
MNPLTSLVGEFELARFEREKAERDFSERMKRIAAKAHQDGVTRYMAQKATGAPVSEVNVWFEGLPMSKPGRRRKDDAVYA